MSATKLVVAMALLLSATSAALAQGPQCYGDRPYYDFYGAGWLDSELHLGIDCNIAPPASAHPRGRGRQAAADSRLAPSWFRNSPGLFAEIEDLSRRLRSEGAARHGCRRATPCH